MPTILWWGRSDPEYSRNRIILNLMSGLGWSTHIFHPLTSGLGVMEAYCRRLKRPDVIWVPCFRHRDIASASYWASRWQVPLIIDPLISAYEKEVFERKKYDPDSLKGRKGGIGNRICFPGRILWWRIHPPMPSISIRS